jgi:hypothetical protein
MMNAYASAAMRMHAHAEQTFVDVSRLGTADHLFGLAAECALKAVLEACHVIPPPPARPANAAVRQRFSTHIDRLWGEYVAWAASQGALQLPAASGFTAWRAEDRYQHDSFFTQTRADTHRADAALAVALLELAILNGVVQ